MQDSGELWNKKESVLRNKSTLVSIVSDREQPYVQTFLQQIMEAVPYSKCHGFNGLVEPYNSINDIIKVFQDSRICVLNVEQEVPPFYAFMAAACRCAIVINNTRWVNHVFADGESCFTYNANDVQSITQSIERLKADGPLLNSMTENAFNIIKNEFNQDESTRKWMMKVLCHCLKCIKCLTLVVQV